ncbi:hypothetical protein T265_14421, partial [Opisthorchis viverrini]
MEYAIQAWSPWLQKDIILLQRIYHRATKLVIGLQDKPYEDRIASLNLFDFYYRRIRGDLILTYNILKTPNHPLEDLFVRRRTRTGRRHDFSLAVPHSRVNCRRNFFAIRWSHNSPAPTSACKDWEELQAVRIKSLKTTCLTAMPPEGSPRAGILPGCPSLDRGSREAEVGLEVWTFRCSTLSVPNCHVTRRLHKGWDTSRLPKPREGSRELEVGFEPRTFRSVNSRSNHLGLLAQTTNL